MLGARPGETPRCSSADLKSLGGHLKTRCGNRGTPKLQDRIIYNRSPRSRIFLCGDAKGTPAMLRRSSGVAGVPSFCSPCRFCPNVGLKQVIQGLATSSAHAPLFMLLKGDHLFIERGHCRFGINQDRVYAWRGNALNLQRPHTWMRDRRRACRRDSLTLLMGMDLSKFALVSDQNVVAQHKKRCHPSARYDRPIRANIWHGSFYEVNVDVNGVLLVPESR